MKTGAWWNRKHIDDYMPTFTVDHAPLVEYLRKMSVLGKSEIPVTNLYLASGLDIIRTYTSVANSVVLLWSLFFTALAIIFVRHGYR